MPTSPNTSRLARRDVGVAGSHDLVDARHALGAVGERGHGLRAADDEHAIDAGLERRRERLGRRAGVVMMISRTPATFAHGTAVKMTVDGQALSAARHVEADARERGVTRLPTRTPPSFSSNDAYFLRSWNLRNMLAAPCSIARRTPGVVRAGLLDPRGARQLQ